jgi:hypothetical protein
MDVPPPDTRPLAGAAPGPAGLLALLRRDQRERWLRGERVPAEWYLEQHPGLAADPEAVLDLAYVEFVLREEVGEAPSEEEYLARFPQHAEALRRQLELHGARCATG